MKEESIFLRKIKEFNKLSTLRVCGDLNINYANLLNNNSTIVNEERVYNELIKRIDEVIGE